MYIKKYAIKLVKWGLYFFILVDSIDAFFIIYRLSSRNMSVEMRYFESISLFNEFIYIHKAIILSAGIFCLIYMAKYSSKRLLWIITLLGSAYYVIYYFTFHIIASKVGWKYGLMNGFIYAEFNLEVQHPAKRPLQGLKIRDTFSVDC
jgi:hypothetical protein